MNETTAAPSVPATPAQSKAALARSLRLCTSEGLVAMPLVTMSLPVNVFMTALIAKCYVLDKPLIGLICALPFVGNFLQIFLVPFFARWRPPKTVTVLFATLHCAAWAVLGGMLHWMPRDEPARSGHWLFWWCAAASILAAVAGVSWNAWVQEWVPARLRGKFFSRRNRLLQFSTLTFLLVTGWSLAHWDYAVPAFQAVIAGAVVLRLCSLRWQWLMPTRVRPEAAQPQLDFAGQVRVLHDARSLLAFIAFGAVWSFAANCIGPFYHVFMFEQAGLSAFNVGLLSTLSALGGALSLPAWGALLDRYGNKSVMVVSLALWQLGNFVWCFIDARNATLLYPLWIWGGATSAGFVLGQFTILLKLIPPEAKSLAIGFNLAVTSLFAAIAPVLGGALLARALAHWPDALAVYHVSFVLQPVLALAGALLLLRVHEPQASPLTIVFGAMRNIRTLGGVLGLDFLVNYVFYRAPRRPR